LAEFDRKILTTGSEIWVGGWLRLEEPIDRPPGTRARILDTAKRIGTDILLPHGLAGRRASVSYEVAGAKRAAEISRARVRPKLLKLRRGIFQFMLLLAALCSSASAAPVLLEFSATSCEPCRSMEPIIAQLIQEGFSVRTIDVDREPELAKRFNASTPLPQFVLVDGGTELKRLRGAQSADVLRTWFPEAKQAAKEPRAVSAARPGCPLLPPYTRQPDPKLAAAAQQVKTLTDHLNQAHQLHARLRQQLQQAADALAAQTADHENAIGALRRQIEGGSQALGDRDSAIAGLQSHLEQLGDVELRIRTAAEQAAGDVRSELEPKLRDAAKRLATLQPPSADQQLAITGLVRVAMTAFGVSAGPAGWILTALSALWGAVAMYSLPTLLKKLGRKKPTAETDGNAAGGIDWQEEADALRAQLKTTKAALASAAGNFSTTVHVDAPPPTQQIEQSNQYVPVEKIDNSWEQAQAILVNHYPGLANGFAQLQAVRRDILAGKKFNPTTYKWE